MISIWTKPDALGFDDKEETAGRPQAVISGRHTGRDSGRSAGIDQGQSAAGGGRQRWQRRSNLVAAAPAAEPQQRRLPNRLETEAATETGIGGKAQH